MSQANHALKAKHAAMRKARRFALQSLYEWQMSHQRYIGSELANNPISQIMARTRATNAMHKVNLGYYHTLCHDICAAFDDLNDEIMPLVVGGRLNAIEHAVLLIGLYELKHSLHIPYKVVIAEAIELNLHFGADGGHRLISAILDKLAQTHRALEYDKA